MDLERKENYIKILKIFSYFFILNSIVVYIFVQISGGISSINLLSIFDFSILLRLIPILIFLTTFSTLAFFGIKRAIAFLWTILILIGVGILYIVPEVGLVVYSLLGFGIVSTFIFTPLIYFLGKFYNRESEFNRKITTLAILIIPFLILFIILILNTATCSFNRDVSCVTDKAIEANDLGICFKLRGDPRSCYRPIISANPDISFCDQIPNDIGSASYEKDICYYTIAKERLDISICENIQGKLYLSNCYEAVGEVSGDPSICESIIEEGRENEGYACYANIALELSDSSICEKIVNQHNTRDSCYTKVAIKLLDPTICEKTDTKRFCYADFGKETNNLELCDIISNEFYKNICYG